MHIYLKGYYGYRNIGDEVLLLGVIQYLADQHSVTSITLETDHPAWMRQWLRKHVSLVPIPVTPVDRNRPTIRKIRESVRSLLGLFPTIVLGGGEVINDRLERPRNGRQYLIQYPGIMLGTQKYLILGGITIDPEQPGQHIRNLLRRARAVILRDETSYEYAKTISPTNVTLYHDWAYDALDQLDVPQATDQMSDYVLLNIHPHILEDKSALVDRLDVWMTAHGAQTIYFVPGDIHQDKLAYNQLSHQYPQLERRDRSIRSLPEILDFIAGADAVAASRLHLLLLMQAAGHEPTVFSYHPKIQKVLGLTS